GKVLSRDPDEEQTSDKVKLSATVKRRREFGRNARQNFYWDELDDREGPNGATSILGPSGKGISFTDSIGDIVDRRLIQVPKSLESKVAVIYGDGNGFGALRDAVGPEAFSAYLERRRRNMLAAVVRWYAAGARDEHWCPAFALRENDNKGSERI